MEEFHWYEDPSWHAAIAIALAFFIFVILQILSLHKLKKTTKDISIYKKEALFKTRLCILILITIISAPICFLSAAFGCLPMLLIPCFCLFQIFKELKKHNKDYVKKFILFIILAPIIISVLCRLYDHFR